MRDEVAITISPDTTVIVQPIQNMEGLRSSFMGLSFVVSSGAREVQVYGKAPKSLKSHRRTSVKEQHRPRFMAGDGRWVTECLAVSEGMWDSGCLLVVDISVSPCVCVDYSIGSGTMDSVLEWNLKVYCITSTTHP